MPYSDSRHIFEYLNNLLVDIAAKRGLPNKHHLTKNVHVWPDFHGNRSPLADSNIKGMICGGTMDTSEENLAITYLAFVQAIAVILLLHFSLIKRSKKFSIFI